MKQQILRTSEI